MIRIMDIQETAELLAVAEGTVRKAIQEGSLKAFKRFGRWYVFESDVIDFIRSGECSTDQKEKEVK